MHLHQMRPVSFYIRIYTVFRQAHVTSDERVKKKLNRTKIKQHVRNQLPGLCARKWCGHKHAHAERAQTPYLHCLSINLAEKRCMFRMWFTRLTGGAHDPHSTLCLTHSQYHADRYTEFNCNFAVDYHVFVQLLNFLLCCECVLRSDWFFARRPTAIEFN